jgi:hypothetical protein
MWAPTKVKARGNFCGITNCQRKIEVEMTTLDAYCQQAAINRIDLLKIDVQGFEPSVLKGARETLADRKIGCVVREVTFIPVYESQPKVDDLHALFAEQQYDLMGFYDFAYSAKNRQMWCEMMFAPHR